MHPFIQFKRATPIILALALACSGLSRSVQAFRVTPDGCYPNFTTAEGCNALNALTTGAGNTALGWRSLFSNSDGSFNTGVGVGALALNNADSNTAVGAAAMLLNTSGTQNVAVGTDAMVFNDTGNQNTAVGYQALMSNTTGGSNTATGVRALVFNTEGGSNTAHGNSALLSNTVGSFNTAIGSFALLDNDTGSDNTAVGVDALFINTGGMSNAAFGRAALSNNDTGNNNTAVGMNALLLNTTGGNNTAVGFGAGFNLTTGSGNVCIGQTVAGVAGESNHTYIRNINTTTVSGGGTDTVTVNLSTGLLGHLSSSRRYKEQIKPMGTASETLYRLNPVIYRYKKEIDRSQSPAFGLIAEEVAAVNPNLVARNSQGQAESVHYEMVNAMLLNEFLKEHQKLEQLTKDFESKLAEQQKQIQQLTAGLQKVSAQLEVKKPAPQTVQNNQ